MPAFVVGLTGGIASGKSTVAEGFAARGVPVIDADQIARDVVKPGEPALDRVVEAFGADLLDGEGRLRRDRLREKVFADEALRRRLESILHPAIRAEMQRRIEAAEGPYVIVMIPLLVEGGRLETVDRVLVVDVPEAVQVERVMARDGVPREQAESILAAQASREERLRHATDVIRNTAGVGALDGLVERLHQAYLEMVEDPASRDRRLVLPDDLPS